MPTCRWQETRPSRRKSVGPQTSNEGVSTTEVNHWKKEGLKDYLGVRMCVWAMLGFHEPKMRTGSFTEALQNAHL